MFSVNSNDEERYDHSSYPGILRTIVHNEIDKLGDMSTLADPSVADSLVKGKL